jgi:hypothetical protein
MTGKNRYRLLIVSLPTHGIVGGYFLSFLVRGSRDPVIWLLVPINGLCLVTYVYELWKSDGMKADEKPLVLMPLWQRVLLILLGLSFVLAARHLFG